MTFNTPSCFLSSAKRSFPVFVGTKYLQRDFQFILEISD